MPLTVSRDPCMQPLLYLSCTNRIMNIKWLLEAMENMYICVILTIYIVVTPNSNLGLSTK